MVSSTGEMPALQPPSHPGARALRGSAAGAPARFVIEFLGDCGDAWVWRLPLFRS